MNLLERKNDCQTIQWKPFATSTPLKSISVNPKIKNGSYPVRPSVFVQGITKRVSDVSKNIQNKQSVESKIENRIIGKNRSRAYFDLSSSDDDDEDYKVENRPVIKIGTENTDKIKVVSINKKDNGRIKVAKNSCDIKRKVDSEKFLNNECGTQQKWENKAENKSRVPNLGLENLVMSLNHENSLPFTANGSNSENNKSLSVASKFSLRNKKKGKSVTKINGKNTALKVNSENHENAKNMPRLLKRKDIEHRDVVSSKKRKEVQTILAKNWANSSHQLFTDTIQEELISTLCLTSPEEDEFITDLNCSKIGQKSITKLKENKVVKANSSEKHEVAKDFASVVKKQERPKITRLRKNKSVKVADSRECELVKKFTSPVETRERPKRTRQAPKKYWIVNDNSKLLKDKTKCTRPSRKKLAVKCEQVPDQNVETMTKKNLTQTAPERKKISAGLSQILNNCHNKGIKKPEQRLGIIKDKSPLVNTKLENASEQPVFLPLNKISYLENEFGYQVSQIWGIKNFNCEVLKLKPGSEFTRKSSQGSNYMGGVLIKGEIKMTIEGKEHVLQEGDMVLIPPFSKYQARNTGLQVKALHLNPLYLGADG